MSEVIKNLKEAINGESNAKRKYELYAEQAIKENLPFIGKLFQSISYAESLHIKNHLKALSVITKSDVNPEEFVNIDENKIKNLVKDTKSNLKDAIKGELYETKVMYKRFVKNAKREEYDVAELSFSLARKAEKVHALIYTRYLNALEKNKPIEKADIYVCQICGNVEFGIPPMVCPVCDHDQKFFKKQ